MLKKRKQHQLFDSLKEHTQDNIDWTILDNWLAARNHWSAGMRKLNQISEKTVINITRRSQRTNATGVTRKVEMPTDMMGAGVVEALCRAILTGSADKPDTVTAYVSVLASQHGFSILFGGNVSITNLVVDSQESAADIAEVCRKAIAALIQGTNSITVKDLVDTFRAMRDNRNRLIDALDELRLTPLILRTRCELCPA